jgi:hypothetical protein
MHPVLPRPSPAQRVSCVSSLISSNWESAVRTQRPPSTPPRARRTSRKRAILPETFATVPTGADTPLNIASNTLRHSTILAARQFGSGFRVWLSQRPALPIQGTHTDRLSTRDALPRSGADICLKSFFRDTDLRLPLGEPDSTMSSPCAADHIHYPNRELSDRYRPQGPDAASPKTSSSATTRRGRAKPSSGNAVVWPFPSAVFLRFRLKWLAPSSQSFFAGEICLPCAVRCAGVAQGTLAGYVAPLEISRVSHVCGLCTGPSRR